MMNIRSGNKKATEPMTDPIKVNNIPEKIKRSYDEQIINTHSRQMAKEVPKQYQRNSEDAQLLKFPSTKNILWDHSSEGDPYILHISYFRKPRLCITEKVLKFAQRHLESINKKSCGCVLVGSLLIDQDGQGVTFDVERMDPVADPNSSTSHAAGDMLIPFTVQNGVKDRGSNSEDYSNALQLLNDRCCSRDPIELGNFLLTKGWCSFYASGDKYIHHLEFDVVSVGTEIKAVPIGPVPIVPTALSKNLSGPMSISHMQGVPKTGYLTMDHTRKLLLVLESDPKVVNLPLVGIWISGVTHVYSPYVWACCLRYIHNSSIQDRVCSPPEPFLLVLYNPSHSKPEFYECSTSTGTSNITFEIYTGYEAVQLSKTSSSNYPTTEVELDLIQSGSKFETFERAAELFFSKQPLTEKRRSTSPETVNEDITPRLKPAPHQSKMPIMQSMVPEVSLFFGNEDTTFVPNINHPKRDQIDKRISPPISEIPTISSVGTQHDRITHSSSALKEGSTLAKSYNVMNGKNPYNHSENKNSSASVPNISSTNGMNSYDTQTRSIESIPSSNPHIPSPAYQHHQQNIPALPAHSIPSSIGYGPYHTGPPGPGVRPGFCPCPSCQKPPPQFYNGFEPVRHPQHLMYSNPGPIHHRMNGPQYLYSTDPRVPHPMTQGPYPPHQVRPAYPGEPRQPYPQFSSQSQPYVQPHPVNQQATAKVPMVSTSQPHLLNNCSRTGPLPQPVSSDMTPQVKNGVQARLGIGLQNLGRRSEELVGPRAEAGPSNPGSDNSSRSSDDSGLSFTPEKQNSPANPSPKPTQPDSTIAGESCSLIPSMDNVPPEIYQLLLQQDKQLKLLQAQIEVLKSQQAKSLNNTVESQCNGQVEKCNMGTNTSLNYGGKVVEQASACMQTSLNSVNSSAQYNNSENSGSGHGSHTGSSQGNRDGSHSSSGASVNESRTPYEIRHRGRVQMNSTQREDVDLDMSQGELVALMNNMHDKTIDSVQSEMIVDLPSFQSSPTRSPRSQESYTDSTAFNISPRSPISASMCEPVGSDGESDDPEEDEEGIDNTGGTDNPEYYTKLMDNIKKMLSQNTTESSGAMVTDGYQGDISSDPSTPVKEANEDIKLGEHLQSFLRFDQTLKGTTDTTFIPKINYVSMFLDSDTDTSMEINAMAMKYLKDEQLTQLTKLQAKNRLLQGSKQSTLLQKILKAEDESTPNVTTVGMSPNDLTFNTKKYMEKHGLLEGGGSGGSGSSTMTSGIYNESYKLKTNYSTVSTGSDGDPPNNTTEAFSTPSTQRNRLMDSNCTPYSEEATPTQNDSRTPRPTHVYSRLKDHRRFTPNGVHEISRDSNGQAFSPLTHNNKQQLREKHNNGANGRYASPQITPAPKQPNHSPPERDLAFKQQIRYAADSQRENEGFQNIPALAGQKNFQQANGPRLGVRNNYQQNEGNNPDDRILDITRLKQLPKLL